MTRPFRFFVLFFFPLEDTDWVHRTPFEEERRGGSVQPANVFSVR